MKENFIKDTPLFAELSDAEQRALSRRMRLEKYNAGETLFAQGETSDALFLIKEGWVKLTGEHGQTVATLGPGSLIGETDFFLGHPYTTTALCSGTLETWSLTNDDFTSIIAERPEIGLSLGLALGRGIAQYRSVLTVQLGEVDLFRQMSERERNLIAERLAPQRFSVNTAIYRSGDRPTGMYIIESGTVRLMGDTDDDYAELDPGELFGEMGIISGKPHAKTAQAANDVIVWQLSPSDFDHLTRSYPSIKSSLSRNLRASLSLADQTYAASVLGRITVFRDLPQEALNDIARLILLRHIPAGELVFNQSDAGDAMYVIDTGAIEAVADNPGRPSEVVGRFGNGDYFGELSLLTGKSRSFTAYATTDTNLWGIYRTDFDNLLMKYPQLTASLGRAVRDQHSSPLGAAQPHLQRLAELSGLSRIELDELAQLLQPRRYQAGSALYYEGQLGQEMFFIESGQVEQWATTMQGPVMLETLTQGDFCGDIALISGRNHPTTAHVLVDSNIWALSRPDFDRFVQRNPNMALTFSRIVGERMDGMMNRLRSGGPQRALPPTAGTMPNPSRPVMPQRQPFGAPPMGGSAPGMPPVGLRPVGGMTPSRPAQPFGMTPGIPAQTQPVAVNPSRPVAPAPASRPEPSAKSEKRTPKPKRQRDSRPQRRVQHSDATVPVGVVGATDAPAAASAAEQVSNTPPPPSRPADNAPKKRRKNGKKSRPVRPVAASPKENSPQEPPKVTAELQHIEGQGVKIESQPTTGRSNRRRRTKSEQALAIAQPRAISNRRLERQNQSVSVWFTRRTLGAKLRLLALLLIVIWLCGIMMPSFIINSLAATFEDNGALPGDDRSVLNQMRQDGAVGAMAMLPFVETATPTPTNTPTPSATPTASATATETPIPTLTHTPTNTPTPTETTTPVFTPTPTETPTPAFTPTPAATRPPTETPTPEPTPTPDVDFRLVSLRQLTPCENRGKHHIFVKVQDPTGQGINGVPVKIEWAPTADGFVIAKTDTKTDLTGQLDAGRLDFAMFKGTYTVQVQGGTSEIATGITPDYGTNESCGEDHTANSLFHISFEVIYQRTF